jgi:hypothetical protein
MKVKDYNNPLAHLREFDDPEKERRVEEYLDDLIWHCHGCHPKVIGMMAVENDNLKERNKELEYWLANMIDFFDVEKVFANHGNVERSYNLKQKYETYQAISEKAWDICNKR